mmetsp:Transcript_23756/g.42496  ORF Transcript_23756/g.42496 Transcript_23756/m.42496 type:complete len:243 (+) Transcript_23756:984-1712(+)
MIIILGSTFIIGACLGFFQATETFASRAEIIIIVPLPRLPENHVELPSWTDFRKLFDNWLLTASWRWRHGDGSQRCLFSHLISCNLRRPLIPSYCFGVQLNLRLGRYWCYFALRRLGLLLRLRLLMSGTLLLCSRRISLFRLVGTTRHRRTIINVVGLLSLIIIPSKGKGSLAHHLNILLSLLRRRIIMLERAKAISCQLVRHGGIQFGIKYSDVSGLACVVQLNLPFARRSNRDATWQCIR